MFHKRKQPAYLIFILLSVCTIFSFSSMSFAATKYVTDKIVLELHKSPSNLSALIEQLPSGTSVTTLGTEGAYTKVETDKNKTGWVETAYLMYEKPASLLHKELLAEHKISLNLIESLQKKLSDAEDNAEFKKNIGWMKVELRKARDKATKLENKLKKNKLSIRKNKGSNKKMESQITVLQKKLKQSEEEIEDNLIEINELIKKQKETLAENTGMGAKISLTWFFVGAGIFLLIGIVGGAAIIDALNRKRHGGFRV